LPAVQEASRVHRIDQQRFVRESSRIEDEVGVSGERLIPRQPVDGTGVDRLSERTTSGWDPTRGATVMMSGAPVKGKAKLKDAWAFDGATMTKLAIKPPILVVDGDAAFSPALGALVVAGGSETWKAAPAPTYELRGDISVNFPPVPAGKSRSRSRVVTTDPVTGLVVAIGLDSAAVYLGSGKWRRLPKPPKGTRVAWFEPTTRTLQATVHIDPMRSQHACAIGDLLDALPPVKR
jgi:hypothetical protein